MIWLSNESGKRDKKCKGAGKRGITRRRRRQDAKAGGVFYTGMDMTFGKKRRGKDSGFRTRVEAVVRQIPRGMTMTYGEVAAAAGRPRAARAVGAIMHSNKDTVTPCHRVVAKNGLGGYNGLRGTKERLLRQEGALKHPL